MYTDVQTELLREIRFQETSFMWISNCAFNVKSPREFYEKIYMWISREINISLENQTKFTLKFSREFHFNSILLNFTRGDLGFKVSDP